jgi:hypothetical protein
MKILIAFIIASFLLALLVIYAHSEELTADQWFRLAVKLQGQSTYLDAEERTARIGSPLRRAAKISAMKAGRLRG